MDVCYLVKKHGPSRQLVHKQVNLQLPVEAKLLCSSSRELIGVLLLKNLSLHIRSNLDGFSC